MNDLNPRTATLSLGIALLCVAAATTSCSSGSGDGTGGTTSASTTSVSNGVTSGSGGGAGGMTSGISTGVNSSGTCPGDCSPTCGEIGLPCCGNDSCNGGACVEGMCGLPFGSECTTNDHCTSKLCLDSGYCSRSCASAAECPPAPEWTCAPLTDHPSDMCQCAPSGPEVCDGRDNDCDGVVDVGAPCSEVGFACQNGVCACNPANLCNGVCEDIASDLQNCGACGNTCAAGAACFQGHCETTLASGQSPASLAVDAIHVYWTNNDGGTSNSVRKVAVGGGAIVTLASGQAHPNHIALDANNVYWTDGGAGTVMKVLLGGGAPTTLASGQTIPTGIAVDATNVYWANNSDPSAVMKMPLGGGAITGYASGQQSSIWNIAVDATSVYMVGHGSIVTKVPLAGGDPITLAPYEFSKASGINNVTVDATHVYWTTDDAVMKVPVDGGAPIVLASGQHIPGGIAVDTANVYWTNGWSVGDVMKIPLDGGTPTSLASGQIAPGKIAVDATSVYWTTNDSVKKAPK